LSPQEPSIIKYGQIPEKLLFDKNVCPGAKVGFSYMHSLPREKNFNINPNLIRLVKQKDAMKKLKISARTWNDWISELQRRGWITVENRGCKSNYITLHGVRKRRR